MTSSGTAAPARTAGQIWGELLEGNRRFVAGRPQAHDLLAERAALAAGQHPKAAVLACADSRVAPEIVFDQGLGDLFVVRTAGNTAGALEIGSLEYACEHLGVTVLVVLGHMHCGAVKAACADGKVASPHLKVVLKPVRAARERAGALEGDPLHRAVERENARLSARDILARSDLLHTLAAAGKLTVIAAYYRLDSGEVERVD